MRRTRRTLNRREVLRGAGALGATVASAGLASPALAQSRPIKIGFVTPKTGPLAIFAEPDDFVLNQFRAALAEGLRINGARHPIEFVVKDSQSSSNRASSVAQELIFEDEVDIITATSTPDTTNPVADQAELNGVPCITNDTPWQPHFFGRQGDPSVGFDYTFHFFWGLEDIVSVFSGIWEAVETNKVVGALWPNDPDGNAWADPERGFPPVMAARGYELVDTGRFQSMTDDFSAQISAFKSAGVEIVTGVVIPPDFTTFWTQAAQQGFNAQSRECRKSFRVSAGDRAALGESGGRAVGRGLVVAASPVRLGLYGAKLGRAGSGLSGRNRHVPWTMPLGLQALAVRGCG